jgi:hypothetical protein
MVCKYAAHYIGAGYLKAVAFERASAGRRARPLERNRRPGSRNHVPRASASSDRMATGS